MNNIVTATADQFKESFKINTQKVKELLSVSKHKETFLRHNKNKQNELLTIGSLILEKELNKIVNRHPN